MQTFDTALVLSELFALEGRLDREQAKANKLAKETPRRADSTKEVQRCVTTCARS